MSRLNKRERVGIIVCAAVVLLGVWLQLTRSKSAGAQVLLPPPVAQQKTEVALRTIRRLRDQQDEAETQIAQLAYTQSPDQLLPRLVRDLQRIADQAGVHLRQLKPTQPHPLTNAAGTRVSLEARFSAPFQPGVMRFLYYVEDPANKMTIDKLDVTAADEKFKIVDVTAQVSAFTTWVGSATGAGGGQNAVFTTP